MHDAHAARNQRQGRGLALALASTPHPHTLTPHPHPPPSPTLTRAKVVSFEPSGANLFHASSSILSVRELAPPARLRLYPIALGASNASGLLYSAIGNAGHSVVDSNAPFYAPKVTG